MFRIQARPRRIGRRRIRKRRSTIRQPATRSPWSVGLFSGPSSPPVSTVVEVVNVEMVEVSKVVLEVVRGFPISTWMQGAGFVPTMRQRASHSWAEVHSSWLW